MPFCETEERTNAYVYANLWASAERVHTAYAITSHWHFTIMLGNCAVDNVSCSPFRIYNRIVVCSALQSDENAFGLREARAVVHVPKPKRREIAGFFSANAQAKENFRFFLFFKVECAQWAFLHSGLTDLEVFTLLIAKYENSSSSRSAASTKHT